MAAPVRDRSAGSQLAAFDVSLGTRYVAGADEAGRGSLAGPLVAAAVLFDCERLRRGVQDGLVDLDDSKKHTSAARERIFRAVLAHAARVRVVFKGPREIDRRGLHRVNIEALAEALAAVAPPDCTCLVDGFELDRVAARSRQQVVALVRGDATSAAVAAASVVAKVVRDRHMRRLAARYPEWGFERHVGYSTPEHREAITACGLTPLHRRSFASVAYSQLDFGL